MERPQLTCQQARGLADQQNSGQALLPAQQALLAAHMLQKGDHEPDCPKRQGPTPEAKRLA